MRKLTAGLFISIDGVVEVPNTWQFDAFDHETGAAMGGMMAKTDAVLMGRVGYEQWAPYWPTAKDPFAAFINPVRKYVASRSLRGDLGWQNASLVEGDLQPFVQGLKAEQGGEIAVVAGISLVRQLLAWGLLDELTLIRHPVLVGKGMHLFDPADPVTRVALLSSQTTSKGNLISTYGRR